MDEGQPQAQAEASTAWRETSDEKTSCKQWTPVEVLRHRLYDKVQIKPPARDMKLKMAMHQDLLRRFSVMASKKKDGSSEEHIKDRFNFVQKPRRKMICKRYLGNAALCVRQDENMRRRIDALGTKIQSRKLILADDAKTDFNIDHAVSTLSCYDNVPREPAVEMGDGIVLESRPDVTKKLENVSIHEPYHLNNDAIPQQTLCTDLIDQTVSLDIGANVQNQPGSQLSVVNSSLVDFSRGFRE